jgi:DNA-binding transcriptional MerR regulator
MTIKEVSEKTGISIDNLRYYERIGLIPAVPRTESGIRNYNDNSLHWIDFVMNFKKAGMPLEDIIEYTKLAMIGDSTKESRLEILKEAKEKIEKKMFELQQCLDIANYKIDNYHEKCGPVTKALIDEWKKRKKE